MLKLAPGPDKFHDFKCGEIFCISSTTYRVACCLCGSKVLFDEFPQHFQTEHLSGEEFKHEGNVTIKHEEEDDEYDNFFAQKVEISDDEGDVEDEKPIDLLELQMDTGQKSVVILNDEVGNTTSKAFGGDNREKSPSRDVKDDNDGFGDDVDWQVDDSSNSNDDSESDEDIEEKLKEMMFPCTKCERRYNTKSTLMGHMRKSHNPDGKKVDMKKKKKEKVEYKCDQCDAVFPMEKNLVSHKYKHTGIVCDICGLKFTQVGNMMRHKIRHTGIRAHKCDECDKTFFTDKEKRAHMLSHTGQLPHICEICGKQVRELRDHMRRHTGERPAKCKVCGKSFFSGHDLNMHAVTHTTERPFACDICSSTFQHKKALRVHKKVHNKIRNHICKICGKAFAQSSGLHAHMRSHDAAQKSSSIANIWMGDMQ